MLAGLLKTVCPLFPLLYLGYLCWNFFQLSLAWVMNWADGMWGMWMKSFTFVRSSLVAFPWAGTSLKLNAFKVSSSTIWVGSMESSCQNLGEHTLGGSCVPSGTCSVGPSTAMKLSPHCCPHTLLLSCSVSPSAPFHFCSYGPSTATLQLHLSGKAPGFSAKRKQRLAFAFPAELCAWSEK